LQELACARTHAQRTDKLVHEWRKVSRVFDNLFFWLIMLTTAGITFGLLLLAPRFSYRNLIEEQQRTFVDYKFKLD
jgi:hypothetical protein